MLTRFKKVYLFYFIYGILIMLEIIKSLNDKLLYINCYINCFYYFVYDLRNWLISYFSKFSRHQGMGWLYLYEEKFLY